MARATWHHSGDTSSVWGQAIESSTDSAYVAPGAIPWLLLKIVGTQEGPSGGERLDGGADAPLSAGRRLER